MYLAITATPQPLLKSALANTRRGRRAADLSTSMAEITNSLNITTGLDSR
jgi:hypothetical protein